MARKLVTHLLGAAVVLTGAACKETEAPFTTTTVADTADQLIFGLEHSMTSDGVLRARLLADTAHYYEREQVIGLNGVTVHFFAANGEQTSTLTSDSGLYYWQNGNMEAIGNVVGTTPDGRRLVTETIEYRAITDQLIGPVAFVFDAPDQHLEGSSFVADPDFTNVEATETSGVVGRIEPGRGNR